MADSPLPAYDGDEPYVFVSYSHEDEELVYPEIRWLQDQGFSVWYDEGISPGHSWPEELAKAIERCSLFLLFVSPESARSENCERETTFALDAHKNFLAVHLSDTELPSGLKLNIGNRQAILKQRLSETQYRNKLQDTLTESLGEVAVLDTGVEAPESGKSFLKPALAVAVCATLVVSYLLFSDYRQSQVVEKLRERSIPQIAALTAAGKFAEAFRLAEEVAGTLPDDPMLLSLWPQFSQVWEYSAQGVDIYHKPYSSPEAPWQHAGTSPLETKLPRTAHRWRFEKDGKTMTSAKPNQPGDRRIIRHPFPPAMFEYADMSYVFGRPFMLPYSGHVAERVQIPAFYIDRYEVTNLDFLDFVNTGGYENPDFWEGLTFERDGRAVSFDTARTYFVDSTGRPGPSNWQLQRFPDGQDDYPVSGVSWYEAVAYARFRGKQLPTVFHWARSTFQVQAAPTASLLVEFANLESDGPRPVGDSHSLGVFGTYDNAGNVREWTWNEGKAGNRWILGGSWQIPAHSYMAHFELPPFDRSELNGIRLAKYIDKVPDGLFEPVIVKIRDYEKTKPISDDAFSVLTDQFRYESTSSASEVEVILETNSGRLEKVSIHPASGSALTIYLSIPASTKKPFHAVIYFPGRDFFIPNSGCESRFIRRILIQKTGRVTVMPIWQGSCERYDGFYQASKEGRMRLRASHIQDWHEDLGRTLDYLDSREDIAPGKYAYYGISYGASRPLPLLALEPRLKAAILYSGGFPAGQWPQIADPLNYVSRISLPVLILGGRYDAYRTISASQRPLYNLLGTPPEHKKMVVFESGHAPLPPSETLREIADWLDKYLGPVEHRPVVTY